MTTIADFVKDNHIKMTFEYADNNPNMADEKWDANHYKCVFHMGRKQLTTFFSMGLGLTNDPTPEEVLDCLASDASGIDNSRTFEDWANEYGYDTDSRKAEKIYTACQRETKKLHAFLGETAYNTLLWETEKL